MPPVSGRRSFIQSAREREPHELLGLLDRVGCAAGVAGIPVLEAASAGRCSLVDRALFVGVKRSSLPSARAYINP